MCVKTCHKISLAESIWIKLLHVKFLPNPYNSANACRVGSSYCAFCCELYHHTELPPAHLLSYVYGTAVFKKYGTNAAYDPLTLRNKRRISVQSLFGLSRDFFADPFDRV